jgi:O-Antigen ligase
VTTGRLLSEHARGGLDREPSRTPPARHGRLLGYLLVAAVAASAIVPLLVGAASAGKVLFPLVAVAVSVVLMALDPELHIGYLWWLWFLTPLIRRFVDYQAGWDETSPILLAPFLATSVCLITVLRHFPKLRRPSLLPFATTLVALPLPFLIGTVRAGPAAAGYGLFIWLVPLAFGYHLAVHRERYPAFCRVTRDAFTWAAAVLGLYGIWQFMSPQPWDQFWMLKSGMESIGQPIAYEVRVFSTLNSPSPFALVMVAGLFSLATRRAAVHWLVGVAAYGSFLLSLVRTAWLAWLIGVIVYAAYLKGRSRIRVLSLAGALLVVATLIVALDAVPESMTARFQSFGELHEDVSYQERGSLYSDFAARILSAPVGEGFGATGPATVLASQQGARGVDSGILDVFFSLGWFGGLLVTAGIVRMLFNILHRREREDDHFAPAARAVVVALCAAIVSLNTLVGVIGVIFWGFFGLTVAGQSRAAPPPPRRPMTSRRGLIESHR